MQTFQTLQDPNNPITPPYFREPQVTMVVKPVEWQGLDLGAVGEFVQFRQPALVPNGTRSILYPTVAWSRQGSSWFFTAQTGLHMVASSASARGVLSHQIARPSRCCSTICGRASSSSRMKRVCSDT